MAERNRPHILLDQVVSGEPFTPVGSNRGGKTPPSPADPASHSESLTQALGRAVEPSPHTEPSSIEVSGNIDGVYVQFESIPDIELALASLDPQTGKNRPELRAVTEHKVGEKTVQVATVFVPDGSVGYFLKQFEQYATERTPKGNRKNANLVERIADIRQATLEALWTDPRAAFPASGESAW